LIHCIVWAYKLGANDKFFKLAFYFKWLFFFMWNILTYQMLLRTNKFVSLVTFCCHMVCLSLLSYWLCYIWHTHGCGYQVCNLLGCVTTSLVNVYKHFEKCYCLHISSRLLPWTRMWCLFPLSWSHIYCLLS
jgi:hypothetical protein